MVSFLPPAEGRVIKLESNLSSCLSFSQVGLPKPGEAVRALLLRLEELEKLKPQLLLGTQKED